MNSVVFWFVSNIFPWWSYSKFFSVYLNNERNTQISTASLMHTVLVYLKLMKQLTFLLSFKPWWWLIYDIHVYCAAHWDSSLCQWPTFMIILQIMNTWFFTNSTGRKHKPLWKPLLEAIKEIMNSTRICTSWK